MPGLRQLIFTGCCQPYGVVILSIAEKHHPSLISIGDMKAHDLGPELRGALDVADVEDHMP